MLQPLLTVTVSIALTVSMGTAQRMFERQGHRELPARQKSTVSVFHGDLDGDARADLVITSSYSVAEDHSGGVWRNLGDGRFESVFDLSGYELVYGLADLDGDGDLDILTATELLVNDGSAAFTRVRHDALPTGSHGYYYMQPSIIDLDGNGQPDFCIGTNWVQDFLGAAPSKHAFPGTNDEFATSAFGDIDADGDLDLVYAQRFGTSTPRLYINDGKGKLTEVTATQMPGLQVSDAAAIRMVDLDGDGDLDILIGGTKQGFFSNDGTGRFSDASALVGNLGACLSFEVGDIDGDGGLDIVAGGVGTGVVLMHSAGTWLRRSTWPHGGRTSNALALVDVDGDQDLDLVQGCGHTYLHKGPPLLAEDHLLMNDGKGTFFDTTQRLLPSGGGSAAMGDLDGDGWADVAYGDVAGVSISFGNAQAEFTSRPTGIVSASGEPVLGDLDGDGDLDLVLRGPANRFYVTQNNGVGGFSLVATYTVPGATRCSDLLLEDLDGDGDLDVFVSTGNPYWANPILEPDAIWLNDGTGKLTLAARLPVILTGATIACAADFDLDGDLDIATGEGVYWRQASGSYTHSVSAAVRFPVSDAIAEDLDGDGLTDLAFVQRGCDYQVTYWNQGGGKFVSGVGFGSYDTPANSLAVGDIDGDGDLDVITGQNGETCHGYSRLKDHIYINQGARKFVIRQYADRPKQGFLALDQTESVLLRDLDGDGDLDVFSYSGSLGGASRSKVILNLQRHLLAPYHLILGRAFELEAHGGNRGAVVFYAFGEASIPLPGLGRLGLDPKTMGFFTSLPAPQSGRVARFQMPIPKISALIGIRLYWQAIIDDSSLRLTNVIAEDLRAW